MAYELSFDGSDLSADGLSARPSSEQGGWETGATPRLRRSGSVTRPGGPRQTGRRFTVEGEFTAADLAGFLALRDALVAKYAGRKGPLFFGRDDRYYKNATLVDDSCSYSEGLSYGVFGVLSLQFAAEEYPEAFAAEEGEPATPTVETLTGTGGTILVVAGTAPALPAWTLTVGNAGTGGGGVITLTNAGTGETMALSRVVDGGLVAGDVLVVDADGYSVTRNGVSAAGLLDRTVPRLKAGAGNVITASVSLGGSLSALSVAYVPRFY